jgi:hypothetical protein
LPWPAPKDKTPEAAAPFTSGRSAFGNPTRERYVLEMSIATLFKAALPLAGLLLALPALAAPRPPAPSMPALAFIEVQSSLCGSIGNCAPGFGRGSSLPSHTLTPEIGRFDLGHDNVYGRYRYEQPDQQLNLEVPKLETDQRVRRQRHLSGSRTLYRVQNLSADHVDWCYARYKSYRAKDNTYKPEKGPRKTCVSPFS